MIVAVLPQSSWVRNASQQNQQGTFGRDWADDALMMHRGVGSYNQQSQGVTSRLPQRKDTLSMYLRSYRWRTRRRSAQHRLRENVSIRDRGDSGRYARSVISRDTAKRAEALTAGAKQHTAVMRYIIAKERKLAKYAAGMNTLLTLPGCKHAAVSRFCDRSGNVHHAE